MKNSKLWYMYTIDYYSAIKRRQSYHLLSMDGPREGIMLNEINQTEKNKYHVISMIRGI